MARSEGRYICSRVAVPGVVLSYLATAVSLVYLLLLGYTIERAHSAQKRARVPKLLKG